MIIDSSAVVAIAFDESERAVFIDAIARAHKPRMSAVSFVEASIVIDHSER